MAKKKVIKRKQYTYKQPPLKKLTPKQKKLALIATIAAVVLLPFFIIVPLDGSMMRLFGNVVGLQDNMITNNTGSSTKPHYYKVGTIDPDKIPMTLTDDTLKSDENVHDFYFKSEDTIVTTVYVSGTTYDVDTLVEKVYSQNLSSYGENITEIQKTTLADKDITYFSFVYQPTEDDIASAAEEGETLTGNSTTAVYFEGNHGYAIVITAQKSINDLSEVPAEEDVLAFLGENVLPAITK